MRHLIRSHLLQHCPPQTATVSQISDTALLTITLVHCHGSITPDSKCFTAIVSHSPKRRLTLTGRLSGTVKRSSHDLSRGHMSQGTDTRFCLPQSHSALRTSSAPLMASLVTHFLSHTVTGRLMHGGIVCAITHIVTAAHPLTHCHRPFNNVTWSHTATHSVMASI